MMSIVIPKKWTRRNLLTSFGKTTAAMALAPFVPILEAGAQENKAIRYIQWFNANALSRTENNQMYQSNNGPTNFPNDRHYAGLNKHKDVVSVAANMHLRASELSPRNPHNDASIAAITGYEAINVTGNTGNKAHSSLDQLIALDLRKRGINTQYESLVMGMEMYRSNFSVSKREGVNPNCDYNPRAVFDRLYNTAQSTPVNSGGIGSKRGSVLDYVGENVNRIKTQVSASDRQKLDRHLTSIEEVERRLDNISDGTCRSFDSGRIAGAANTWDGNEITDAFIDIIVAAFACDLTRVAAFQGSAGHDFHNYNWVNAQYSGDFHAWTHGNVAQAAAGDRERLPDAKQRVQKAMEWRTAKIVSLLDKLQSIEDVDGTLLDNSGLMWWTETAAGHAYNNATWIVAGKMGGNLKTGRRFDCNGQDHNKLLTTIAQAAGVQTNRVGNNKFDSGTFSELL